MNNDAFAETSNELLLLKCQELYYPINDKDFNIDIDMEKDTSPGLISSPLSENSKSSSASVVSQTQSKMTRRKIAKANSKDSEIVQPPIEELQKPQWLTENQSIAGELSIEQNNLIQFYDNPLNELSMSNAVG